mmetsp:Transcript_6176/g.9383  ORF Transcript_6176/g.9383 Transcript_6176/m.9383 type:complete len:182 (+) Transcript_6176:796-1341(+)
MLVDQSDIFFITFWLIMLVLKEFCLIENLLLSRQRSCGERKTVRADRLQIKGTVLNLLKVVFFDSVPVARDGDAYCMRMLLHDWSDDESYHILSNIRRAMNGTNAVLFIGEVALPEKTYIDRMYYPTYQADIQMLHMFGNAKERTPLMWKELLDHSGFDFVRIHRTRSMFHFVQALPRPAS